MNYSIFDVVVLITDLPEEGLASGSIGTIVDVYHSPKQAFEIEFCDSEGRTLALLPLRSDQIRPYETNKKYQK